MRSVIRQQFELGQSAIEFLHEWPNAFTAKSVDQSAVVPKGASLAAVESRPEFFSFLAVIHHDRANVVQFV